MNLTDLEIFQLCLELFSNVHVFDSSFETCLSSTKRTRCYTRKTRDSRDVRGEISRVQECRRTNVDTTTVETLHGDVETFSFFTESVADRNSTVFKNHLSCWL